MKVFTVIMVLISNFSFAFGQADCDRASNRAECRLQQANNAAQATGQSFAEDEEIKGVEIALALMNALTSSMAFGSLGAPATCPDSMSYQIFIWTARLQSFFEIFWFRGFSAQSAARAEIFEQEMNTEAGDYAQILAYEFLIDENNDTADYYEKKYQYHTLVGAVYIGAGVLAALELMGVICPPTHNGISARIADPPPTDQPPEQNSLGPNGDPEPDGNTANNQEVAENLTTDAIEGTQGTEKVEQLVQETAPPPADAQWNERTPGEKAGHPEANPYAAYSNDPQTQKMLEKLNANAENRSTGYCARYVNRAMAQAGIWPNGGKGNAIDLPKSLDQYGYTNIYTGPTGSYQSSNVPVGSVIVYKANHHSWGHVEVYDGKNYISDYKSPRPIDKSANGHRYTVHGIYVKGKT